MQPSLRIHFIANYSHSQGTYFRFHNLAIGLTALGHTVNVFVCDFDTKSKPRQEVRDGVHYHIITLAKGTSVIPAFFHPVTAIVRTFVDYPECDVIHLFQPFPNAALSWLLRKKCAKVAIYDWDDLWAGGFYESGPKMPPKWMYKLTRYLEESLPQKATHVTTCSRFLADLATQHGAKGTTVIRNGFWPFTPLDKQSARKNLALLVTQAMLDLWVEPRMN